MRVVDRSYALPADVEVRLRRAFWSTMLASKGIILGIFPAAVAVSGLVLDIPWSSLRSLLLFGLPIWILFAGLNLGSYAITAMRSPWPSKEVVAALAERGKPCVTALSGGYWITTRGPWGIRMWIEDTDDGARIVGTAASLPSVRWVMRKAVPQRASFD